MIGNCRYWLNYFVICMLGLPHIQTYYQQSRLRIITGSLKKLQSASSSQFTASRTKYNY